ncbi:MAG: cardiolipin synthase [Clostridium sp.]
MKKLRGLFRIIFGRTTFLVLFLLMQVATLFYIFNWLKEYTAFIFGGFTVFSALILIYIISADESSNIKLSWVVPILVVPVFGAMFYLFVKFQIGTKLINGRYQSLEKGIDPFLIQDAKVLGDLDEDDFGQGNLARYMKQFGKFPTYDHTNIKYLPLGEDMFEEMKTQLRQAKHFIFMEFFIVERGFMWNSILDILEEKAKEGVEVRFMYDGMCCLILLPYSYPKVLQAKGIKCKMFSPIKPALSSHQNNRDHRKICVIDGHTAFTGGVNLADEYINKKQRFGHWKDTAIMVKGDAVTSFTMMFLQMWGITEPESEDYSRYLRPAEYQYPADLDMNGFVMPYGDSPLDKENVGEQVYLDILGQAKQYVHIMTPYLILDDELVSALKYAPKRGVETVIIMPHIPDKLYAYLLARSYYEELLAAGVKIYEYTPGFIHAKMFTCDDEKAVVGTINLDYRSLYLHFECAAYMYKNAAIHDIESDFQKTLLKCQEITPASCKKYPYIKQFAGKALRLFAPLM